MPRLLATLVLLVPAAVLAGPFTPSPTPVAPDGTRAVVDLPKSQHIRNTGGMGRGGPGTGAGLCVFTSGEVAGDWQNLAALRGWQKWMTYKPGGGYPQKFTAMLGEFCREKGVAVPPYVQHTGGDDGFLDLAIRTGRCPCVTYAGDDDFYPGGIDHMVNLAHLDGERAAIIDNNRPGIWLWMSRADFLRRWRARGGGWAVVFLGPPPTPYGRTPISAGPCRCDCCGPACICVPGHREPDCLCEPCPAAVVFGQNCPGGVCPAPRPLNPFAEPVYRAPPGTRPLGNGWHTDGTLYYLVGKGAYNPADGRWTPLDPRTGTYGAWGPLPAQVVPPRGENRPSPMDLPTGVVSDKIHDAPRFSISGHACDRKSAFAALLSDDTSRWHLAAVGDDAFLGRVEADFARLPAATRDQLHLQLYRPGDWEVGQFGLPASGLVLRKPAAGRQSGDVGQVPAADYSAEKLDEVLCKPSGPTPRPVPAPAPRPVDPVDPDQPAPGPAPEPAPNPVVPPWTLAAALFAILLLLRRK